MKKLALLLVTIASLGFLTGCGTVREGYKSCPLTPESFNYTFSADHEGFKPAQHYFGLSWSLK